MVLASLLSIFKEKGGGGVIQEKNKCYSMRLPSLISPQSSSDMCMPIVGAFWFRTKFGFFSNLSESRSAAELDNIRYNSLPTQI